MPPSLCALFLELDVWCGSGRPELQALLHLAGRVRLRSCTFRQLYDDVAAATRVSELLAHPGFVQLAGGTLRCLAGAPATLHGGKHTLHPFPLGFYPSLESLQLYVPPHQQRLSIGGRHYVALRLLPPRLRQLEVSAWHVLAEPEVLVRCPEVSLLAAAVLLSEHVLPYAGLAGAAGAAVAEAHLCELALLLAAAGLPKGHRIKVQANLVCFQRSSDGADAKLVAPHAAAPAAAAAAAAADGGQAGGAGPAAEDGSAFPRLSVLTGGVRAVLQPAPGGATWPAALGPNAPPGTGPDMQVVLSNAA
ncbi:hypothetical protein ABPG75_008248 [Micractinium tetrahymenae]